MMNIRNVFCPVCGCEIQVNADREFLFCTECGNKIVLSVSEENKKQISIVGDAPDNLLMGIQKESEISKKLEEVSFYYKLSCEKKEYENCDSDPTYYLKAQDILVDLSEEYPDDYRVWWELCKPVDYACASLGSDVYGQYHINQDYFNKALDKADLSKKRELIEEYDRYTKSKEESKKIAAQRLADMEQKRREKELAEKKAHEIKCEQERLQAEAEQRRKAEEKQREELKRQEQEKERAAELETNLENSKPLWLSLFNKDYSKLNNTFFEVVHNSQKMIVTFRLFSNMFYLNSYRVDVNKGNVIYQEQGFAIQFNAEGLLMKFNNTPVIMNGCLPPNNIMRVTETTNGELYINNYLLKTNRDYINGITKIAKKPLMSFSKLFS